MIKTVFEQGTRIGRVARLPNLRRLILLSVLCALASLAVSASASAETLLFSNPTPIAIPGSGDIGNASPYPSEIAVSGMSGPITNVAVTLHRFGHNVRDHDVGCLRDWAPTDGDRGLHLDLLPAGSRPDDCSLRRLRLSAN